MKRCGPAVRDAILGHVEPVVSDPRDELPVPDIIGSGGEDFSAFAESRWPGLVKRAFGLTGDRRAAEDIAATALASAYVAWWRVSRTADPDACLRRLLVKAGSRRPRADRVAEPPGDPPQAAAPVPLATIVRRGKRIRLRRAGIAVGGLSVAATILLIPHSVIPHSVIPHSVIPHSVVTPRSFPLQTFPVTVPYGGASSSGVFASGTADGHAWRLAVQDIADPGYRCLPAITLDGADADPVYPDPGNAADVALGPADPGIGFAFVQVPAGLQRLTVDGRENLPVNTVTACGQRYRVVGFAYPLSQGPTITAVSARPRWPKLRMTAAITASGPTAYQLPPLSAQPPATATHPQTAGIWNNVDASRGEAASAIIATGHDSGQDWSITLMFGPQGDCYVFRDTGSLSRAQTRACGPVGTPLDPETIMALPMAFPDRDRGATGYAGQVSPSTTRLKATLSDGSSELVTPQLVAGRKYVAFIVGHPLRLTRLTWLNAAGQTVASGTGLPPGGSTKFLP